MSSRYETWLNRWALPLRYADTLIQQREETLAKGQEFLTWNDVQKCIDTVNVQVHEEHERKEAVFMSSYLFQTFKSNRFKAWIKVEF